jgi:hypothetical protein
MTRALVCSALISSYLALGQGISTKQAYLPSVVAKQVKAALVTEDDCPPLAGSISTTWLRLSHNGSLSVGVDGFERCFKGENNRVILLYSRHGKDWHKVLDTKGNRLRRLSTEHHGWHDIDVLEPSGLFISVHLVFRFDGDEYKLTDCVEVDNTSGGPPRPKIHTCSFNWRGYYER